MGRADYELRSNYLVKWRKLLRKKNRLKTIRDKFTAVHLGSDARMIKCTSKERTENRSSFIKKGTDVISVHKQSISQQCHAIARKRIPSWDV